MMRFLGLCLVLAIGCVAAVVAAGNFLSSDPGSTSGGEGDRGRRVQAGPQAGPQAGTEEKPRDRGPQDDRSVTVVPLNARGQAVQALILPDGRVLPADRVEVPSDRDGSLLMVATLAQPGEYVPPHKRIVRTMTLLAVEVQPGENVAEDERIIDVRDPARLYRQPRDTDVFEPGRTAVVPVRTVFRKLAEDDQVEEGQILGIVRPDLAVVDLEVKQAKMAGARSEYQAAKSTTIEMQRLFEVATRLRNNNALPLDEVNKAKVQWERAKSEEVAKGAGVVVSQREMSASWTTLKLHVIRAPIAGTIRTLYKQGGEAVKNQEQVLLLQNLRQLRVETQVEVQDALPLRQRLEEARAFRDRANRLSRGPGGAEAEREAKELRERADALVAVEVEASQPQPPVAALRGHLQDVTCVAVSRGPDARIISGSDEGIVRVWQRIPGAERWEERVRLIHGNIDRPTPVRALACTPPAARKNLLMTATSTGRIRLFDLDDLKAREVLLPEHHQGSVQAIAFSADGTLAATGGEDRSICVWNVLSQRRLLRKVGAHQSAITSLAFTPTGQLVSAGRDKGLIVWKIEDGDGNDKTLTTVDRLPGRSGDVAHLGLDPTGQFTLADEGRELRVVALSGRTIEGSISNSGASGSFSTFALFSPDGKTVLTNGNAPGRLQLWRAPSAKTRAAELRQFLWSNGVVTCGAFDPAGGYAVTGTSDHKVLVWKMPSDPEAYRPLRGELSYVEGFLDTSLKRITLRATLDNSRGLVIPGAAASIIVPPLPAR